MNIGEEQEERCQERRANRSKKIGADSEKYSGSKQAVLNEHGEEDQDDES